MKNETFTITSTDLNTGTDQTVTIPIAINKYDPAFNLLGTTIAYPLQIEIDNRTSGAIVEFNTFESETELAEYIAKKGTDTYWKFYTIPAGSAISNTETLGIKFIVIRCPLHNSTNDLYVRCLNYKEVSG